MNHYELKTNWPNLPAYVKLGSPTGMGIDSHQNLFIFHRADRKWNADEPLSESRIVSKTILVLHPETGELLDSWGEGLFIMPHGLTVDVNDDIWLTDVGLHQVFKFSHTGKLLMALGEPGVPGNDPLHFNLPTAVAVACDGSFYVTDGYGNNRVIKFSSTGGYLFEWGKKGRMEGEFNLPHAIDLDETGNIYVADRENKRVQVFTPAGVFITQWTNDAFGYISAVAFDKVSKGFFAADYATSVSDVVTGSGIIFFDQRGNVMPTPANTNLKNEGINRWYHNIIGDKAENIYVTDILGNTVQKFIKVQGNYR